MHEPWWITIVKAFVVINVVMVFFAFTTWLERKLLGRMQLRYGPNRAGPKGLLVPIADLVKLIRKEAFAPSAAKEPLYIIAPVVSMATALLAFSVIPWGAGWHFDDGKHYIGGAVVNVPISLILISALCVTLFFGGYHFPWVNSLDKFGPIWFVLKLFTLVSAFIWLRATQPRLRYDQLMRFGWKILLPVATLNALVTAALVVAVK
jgi:NADH:ubiquinone oxidoreductase subunit H